MGWDLPATGRRLDAAKFDLSMDRRLSFQPGGIFTIAECLISAVQKPYSKLIPSLMCSMRNMRYTIATSMETFFAGYGYESVRFSS
jgi:hypothetical protein